VNQVERVWGQTDFENYCICFSSVAVMLGGCRTGERGNINNVSRSKAVEAVLDFAEASQRFRSRVPDGQPNKRNGN